ncbi:hypothetical protein GCM10028803_07440 [Larkinella knui]|uniref:Lipoprotein n=1 Tax=Larkinella knui TaxID=2025310 RepID=A0A3P1CJR4_9BACT|nr:hypothetical protein [Larkinella knui]RRB13583.1 hypothetical protein EHT87_15080 [Larkinella knui]
MKLTFLLSIIAVAGGLCGCEPQDNPLVISTYNGHTLQLIDHTTVRSIGERNHQAVLIFDGKLVSDQNIGFPLLPENYSDWVIRNYDLDLSSPEQTPWTVYMSPKTFTRAEYDQMIACFEVKWSEFDSTLTNFSTPNYGKSGRIERIVYGEAPQPMVFRPARLRYQTVYGPDADPEETFIIRPDGTWSFTIASNGDGSRFVANAANGTLLANNGQLSLEKPFEIDNPMLSVRPDMIDLSDPEYFQSFTDSTGKPLLSVIKYPF